MKNFFKSHKILTAIISAIVLVLWVGIIYLATQYLLALLFRWIFQPTENNTLLQSVYSTLVYIIAALVIIFVPYKLNKKWRTSLEDLGLIELPTWTDIGLAPIGFIVYILLANIIVTAFSSFSWFDATESQDVGYNSVLFGADRLIALTILVVVAPIAEEIIFRGFLYGNLKKYLTKWTVNIGKSSKKNIQKSAKKTTTKSEKAATITSSKSVSQKSKKFITGIAVFLTSLLFGFLHGQWNVGVNVFVMSIVLCLMREVTGTIYSGIIMHMIKNALAFYLLYVVGMG